MLRMIKGAWVPDANKLYEGYELYDDRIIANVNADNIRSVTDGFIEMNEELSLFLFLEVPTNLNDESFGTAVSDKPHKDIYYLDGISAKTLRKLLDPLYDILINDGLSAFGVGNPYGDEIGKYKYNSVMLFSSRKIAEYVRIFENLNIPQTEALKTAYDTFSQKNPGVSKIYEDSKKRNIYTVVEQLKRKGLYMAERRED